MTNIYYHNPRCSKSRQGLEILKEANADFEIKEYLKESLSLAELEELFLKLGKSAREGMRTKESIYKELELFNEGLSDSDLFNKIVENPILLERPIFKTGSAAVIGRPPELIKDLL